MNDNLGIGVMISQLGGNKQTVDAYERAIGMELQHVELLNDILVMRFTDGRGIQVYDDGQSCCETRYITTDDKLSDFVGATLVDMELRDAPNVVTDDAWDEHEVQFLLVNTSKGTFTLETHNEHNGYYDGFAVVIRELPNDSEGLV